MTSRVELDSASVQRIAVKVIAISALVSSGWAKPSESMMEVRHRLVTQYGIDDPEEWARWAFTK